MLIQLKYELGQEVYLKTDPEQLKRIIVEVKITPGGGALYLLTCGTVSSEHYDFEISIEKDQLTSIK